MLNSALSFSDWTLNSEEMLKWKAQSHPHTLFKLHELQQDKGTQGPSFHTSLVNTVELRASLESLQNNYINFKITFLFMLFHFCSTATWKKHHADIANSDHSAQAYEISLSSLPLKQADRTKWGAGKKGTVNRICLEIETTSQNAIHWDVSFTQATIRRPCAQASAGWHMDAENGYLRLWRSSSLPYLLTLRS